jgi:hypothetical protein
MYSLETIIAINERRQALHDNVQLAGQAGEGETLHPLAAAANAYAAYLRDCGASPSALASIDRGLVDYARHANLDPVSLLPDPRSSEGPLPGGAHRPVVKRA